MSDAAAIADLRARVAKLERTIAFLSRHLNVEIVDAEPSQVHADVLALVRSGDRMGAITLHRRLTGAGLKEAKELIETLE